MMHPWPVPDPKRVTIVLAAFLVAAWSVAGCAADAVAPTEEVRHVLEEPWQAQPFAIDQTVVANADRACREFDRPPGVSLAVVDARGGSTVLLVYARAGAEADCLVSIGPNGATQSMGGGSSSGGFEAGPGPGEVTVLTSGSNSTDLPSNTKSTVIGRAGAGVARVEVRLANDEAITASLGPTGWFAAWWPSESGYLSIAGYDGVGTVTGTTR
jgi:hypothetical protein